MTTENSPFGIAANHPHVQEWRKTYYSPEKLRDADSSLHIVAATLEKIVDTSAIGRCYNSDKSAKQLGYTRSFSQQIGEGESDRIVASLEVQNLIFDSSSVLREEIDVVIKYDSPRGERLGQKAYRIQKFAGGTASMDLASSLDTYPGAQLDHRGITLPPMEWKDGTEHDATLLFDEICDLLDLQQEDGSMVPEVYVSGNGMME